MGKFRVAQLKARESCKYFKPSWGLGKIYLIPYSTISSTGSTAIKTAGSLHCIGEFF